MRSLLPLAALCLVLLLVAGCWTDEAPDFGPNTTCNHNGTCDPLETCEVCPSDCPCCVAMRVATAQQVAQGAWALGKGDGRAASLRPNAILELELGGQATDTGTLAGGDQVDLELVGKVTGNAAPGGGYFIVSVLDDAVQPREWKFLGSWNKSSAGRTGFDLDQANLSRSETRFLRIQGLVGSRATLDAVVVKHCVVR